MPRRPAKERELPELTQEWKEKNQVREALTPPTTTINFDEVDLQDSTRVAQETKKEIRAERLELEATEPNYRQELHYSYAEREDLEKRGANFFTIMQHYGPLPAVERKALFIKNISAMRFSEEDQIAQIERFDDVMAIYDDKQQANQRARESATISAPQKRAKVDSTNTFSSSGGAFEGSHQPNRSNSSSAISGAGGGGLPQPRFIVPSIQPQPQAQGSSAGEVGGEHTQKFSKGGLAQNSAIQGSLTEIREALAPFSSSSSSNSQASKDPKNSTKRSRE